MTKEEMPKFYQDHYYPKDRPIWNNLIDMVTIAIIASLFLLGMIIDGFSHDRPAQQ